MAVFSCEFGFCAGLLWERKEFCFPVSICISKLKDNCDHTRTSRSQFSYMTTCAWGCPFGSWFTVKNHRIVEFFRLEKTFMIIESNC